jgi:hypothetical protein
VTAAAEGRAGTAERVLVVAVAAFALLPTVLAPLQGLAWRAGLPEPVVRAMLAAPDLALVAILVVGARALWRQRRLTDRLDVATTAFVALVTGYFLADRLAHAFGSDLFPRATDDLELQALAARAAIGGPLLLVAGRGVPLAPAMIDRLLRVVLLAAVALAVPAIFESLFPAVWERLGADVLGFRALQREVYGVDAPPDVVIYTYVGDRKLVRAGSFLFEYLQLGFLLLPGLAVALLRTARQPRRGNWLALSVIGAAVIATVSRSAIAAAIVVTLVVWRTRRSAVERRRVGRMVVAAAAVVLLLAVPTGLATRLLATGDASDDSTPVHVESTTDALDLIGDAPLGIGLGTGAATASRLPASATLVSENAYLDVALQVGVVGGAAFLVVLFALGLLLGRHLHTDVGVVALAVGLAMALGGFVLHTWQMVETSWLLLALAGLALPRVPLAGEELLDERAPSAVGDRSHGGVGIPGRPADGDLDG